MRQFHFDFYSFSIFWIGFFLNGFPISFIVHSWSNFLFSERKFFELYVRTCPAMFFYFVVMIFVMTIWRHSHFLFIRSCNFNSIACVTSFFALGGASFFVHARDYIFGQTWLTSLSKLTSSIWNWLLFTLIQRDKVKWVCVTLNEGYLRSANRGSNKITYTDF